ncbi:MAG: hypothetical protein WCS30_12615 [Selenomonadaceae bacterium]
MSTLGTILLLLAFVFITDAFDSKKKKAKRRTQQPPMPQPAEDGRRQPPIDINSDWGKKEKPKFEIPDIKRESVQQDRAETVMIEETPQEITSYMKYRQKKHEQEEEERIVYEEQAKITPSTKKQRKTDIHTNVIMNAIAYAQMLDRPKAYNYMKRYGGFRRD